MARTTFALVALAALLAALVEADATAWRFRGGLRALVDDPECAKSQKELSCDGCNKQVRCSKAGGAWLYMGTERCPASTPYCEPTNATCTADASLVDPTCTVPEPSTTFKCSDNGYWPDMTTCTKYYICSDNKAYSYDCGAFSGTVYDHQSAGCVPRTATNCFTLTCPSAGSFVAYTPDPSIYAVCRNTTASAAAVLKCDAGRTLNATTKECKTACTKAGRIAVGGADTKGYIDCVDLGANKLSAPTPGRCPGKSNYNADKQRCIE